MAPGLASKMPHKSAPDLLQEASAPFLRAEPRAASPEGGRGTSVEAIRERYLHHLAQQRLVQGGYVPNLVPILTWHGSTSGPPSAASTPGIFGGPPRPSPRSRWELPAPKTLSTHQEVADSPSAKEGLDEGAVGGALARLLRPGSIRSSVVNITAAALGAGALSLPRAIYYSGILFGPLLMVMLAALSVVSIKVIVQLVELSGKNSYEEIAKAAFGPWFALLVEVNIVLFCFGTAVAYMITVGQVSHQVLDAVFGDSIDPGSWWSALMQPNAVLVLTTMLVLLPLSLLDSINDLRYASLAGVSCILYLILVVGYVFLTNSISPSLLTDEGFSAWQPKGGVTGCFKMLSLSIFAFCCQPNVPSIYTELEKKSYSRMQKVSVRAMLLCCVVYLLMGVTGFLAFGEDTLGNILGNLQPMLCHNDWVVRSGVACMAFAVTMAFPLNIFPIRFTVETALFYRKPHLNTREMRTGIAVAAVAASLVAAIALPQINLIFELIGATTGSFVCFISPGMLFTRLVPGRALSSHKLKAVLLIVAGCVFLLLGTYSSVLDVMAQLSSGQDGGDLLQCRDLAEGGS